MIHNEIVEYQRIGDHSRNITVRDVSYGNVRIGGDSKMVSRYTILYSNLIRNNNHQAGKLTEQISRFNYFEGSSLIFWIKNG